MRKKLFERQSRFHFEKNKGQVVRRIVGLLGNEG
jgi:hypothetical protein